MQRTVLYEELIPAEFQARLREAPIAYLPLGTLEWHGLHMPLGADGIQARGFFSQLAAKVGGIVLPMLFLGPDTQRTVNGKKYFGMDFEGSNGPQPVQLTGSAYWVSDSVFLTIMRAILAQLTRAGFRVVMAHGHGPSVDLFEDHRSEWKNQFRLETLSCRLDPKTLEMGLQTDHAGANETSLMMALRPDLVKIAQLPPDLNKPLLGIEGEDPRTCASPNQGKRAIGQNIEYFSRVLSRKLAELK